LENFALHVHGNFAGQIALGHGSRHFGDVTDLRGKIGRHGIDVIRQVFPSAGHTTDFRLAAKIAFSADFAGDARHFGRETIQLVHHGIDGIFQFENFAFHVHGDLAGQVAFGHGGGHFGDVTDLRGKVRRHGVHGIGQIFPRTGHTGHFRLAAQDTFGADLARHARHFGGEAVQLVHHRIDGVFQFENFALHVHRNLAGQVALGHSGRHFGNVTHLRGEVGGHGIDVVGQVLPRAGHAGHGGLPTEFAFGTDFASHARHFGGESVQLVHHDVDGVFEFENFTFDVHRDFAGEVATGDGSRHLRDVTDLRREVGGHGIDVVGQVLPRAGHARHERLAAELAFSADFAGHACHFGCKRAQLFNHRINSFLELEDFTANVHGDLLGKVTVSHGDRNIGDVTDLRRKVTGHLVDRLGQFAPHAGNFSHLRLAAELAFDTHFARHANHFHGEAGELFHHAVDQFGRAEIFALQWLARNFRRHRLG